MTTKELTRTDAASPEPMREGRRFVPLADIYENDEELTVMVDLPGVNPGDIDIRLDNGVLSINGKASRRQDDHVRFALQEYEVGDYLRTFEVGDAVNGQNITADHRDGVLTLHLPKSDKVRPRRIQIRSKS